jgi:dTDP-4-dehydrorhamnose 3,5-epimerase-like enzyme
MNKIEPKIIQGHAHSDYRGTLFCNNDFNAKDVKRFYIIENNDIQFIRAWRGHKIEQRWFSVAQGSFKIELIEIDDWKNPSKNLLPYTFELKSTKLNILHIPRGFITSIQSLEENSKLLVMADYLLGEIKDEYRYEADYFSVINSKV